MIFLPAFVVLVLMTAMGVGFWLSAINVRYRDVKHMTPFLMPLWLSSTPVAYPSSILPPESRTLYGINPMVGVVEGFRWCLLRGETVSGAMILVSAVAAVGIFVSGMYYFRRVERTFADIV